MSDDEDYRSSEDEDYVPHGNIQTYAHFCCGFKIRRFGTDRFSDMRIRQCGIRSIRSHVSL